MNKGNDLIKPQRISNNIYYFHLVCLDENLNRDNNDHFSGIIQDLEQIVYSSHIFSDFHQCIDYITNIQDDEQKAIMIYSGESVENIISFVQDIPQINSIYILRRNRFNHEEWRWLSPKMKDEYDDLTSICKSIKQTIRKYYQDYLTLPYLQPNTKTLKSNRNELEPSFMYTLIFKEIFLDPDFEPKHFHEFIDYCREKYCDNGAMLEKVIRFEQGYKARDPISWYTDSSFIFSIVNEALRTMNVDLIIKFDFFIRDLHHRITSLHSQQFGDYRWDSFQVYRGQVVPRKFFDKLQNAQGGLVSFNNFLSTSLELDVALMFATPEQPNSTDVGVLFRILLNPTIKSNVFANIQGNSSMTDEEEILFSMHSVFRLGEMKIHDADNRIWEVDLTLTTDIDEELCEVAEAIRRDAQGSTPWERLGHLMIKMDLPQQAESIYKTLLQNATTDDKIAHFYHQLGVIQVKKYDFETAEQYYKRSQEICQNYDLIAQALLPEVESDLREMRSRMDEHPETSLLVQKLEMTRKSFLTSPHLLYTSINNIGAMYDRQGDVHKAIRYYEEALEMREKSLPPNDPLLAASYCSTGTAYSDVGEYKKAIVCLEKALEIQQKSRPANRLNLAITYNGLGSTYFKMKDYPRALSCYNEALKIQKKTLPETHSDLATSYNNIGEVYSEMGDYPEAESYHRRALEMRPAYLSENHPETAISYNNLGSTYSKRKDYSKAISFYEKAVAIQQNIFPESHPDLATSYQNMGKAYYEMGDYSKAISCSRDALAVRKKYLPINHASLVAIHTNIGSAYLRMADYLEAKSSYEKALEIEQQSLAENRRELASCNDNLGSVYLAMENYPRAISYYEKAFEIRQESFSKNHPELAASFDNIGLTYCRMGKYSEALPHYKKGLAIHQSFLSKSDPNLAISYNNVGLVYHKMGQCSEALSSYEEALKIQQKSLPANHPDSAAVFNNIGLAYCGMSKHSKAISYYVQAAEIQHKSLGSNHPELAASFNNIASACYEIGIHQWAMFFALLAVDIGQRKLPKNHSNNIQYCQTLEFIRRAACVSKNK